MTLVKVILEKVIDLNRFLLKNYLANPFRVNNLNFMLSQNE